MTQVDYMNIAVPVFYILPTFNCSTHVQDYAGLVELAGGEKAHISISDGSVLGLKLYSILPGSKNRKEMTISCISVIHFKVQQFTK